jgi:hypothetical protein
MTVGTASTREFARRLCPVLAVRPDGANPRWRKNPPGELSIDPVADERLAGNRRGWSLVTKVASGRLSDLAGRNASEA